LGAVAPGTGLGGTADPWTTAAAEKLGQVGFGQLPGVLCQRLQPVQLTNPMALSFGGRSAIVDQR